MNPEPRSIAVAPEYLSLPQLATYGGLSERTLRTYLGHPAYPLPCYKIGGRVLVRRGEYDSWAARFRSVAPSTVDALVRDTLRGL